MRSRISNLFAHSLFAAKRVRGDLQCCLCGSHRARIWRLAGDNLLGGETVYRALRCSQCGVVRLDPRPSSEKLAAAYPPQTYARAEEAGSEVGKRLDAYALLAADRAEALVLKSEARALDVGCGDGRFMAVLQKDGWQVEGTETDPVAADLARKRTGMPIHAAPVENMTDLPADSFDFISLLHVLEHVDDPRRTLVACHHLLKSDGAILLHLPNVASLEAKIFGTAWYHLDLPRHLWGFTPKTLRKLLIEAGFTAVRFRYLPFLFAPQSLRNRGRRSTVEAATTARGSGGRLQTTLFRFLLAVSSKMGRLVPGEIMEVTARRSDSLKIHHSTDSAQP